MCVVYGVAWRGVAWRGVAWRVYTVVAIFDCCHDNKRRWRGEHVLLLLRNARNPKMQAKRLVLSTGNVTDSKILSKDLSSRLSKVLEEIVHPDQTCSVPGRKIQDNLQLIRNLIK